jgi:tetratricopeptide (TPR) repeat protein
MNTCPSCGASAKNAERCENCGFDFSTVPNAEHATATPASPTTAGIGFCIKCGSTLIPGARFCATCGNAVGAGVSSSSPDKNKTLLVAVGAVLVVVAVIVVTQMLVKEKPKVAAPETAQQQAAPPGEMPSGPTPQQLQMIETFKKQVAENPADTLALLHLANTLYDVDNATEAIPYYVKYLEANPKNVDARVDYAYCLFRTKQNEAAVVEINKAIKVSPKHQAAYFNLGVVYLSMGKMPEGAAALNTCIELDSTSRAGKQAVMLLSNHMQMFQKQQ